MDIIVIIKTTSKIQLKKHLAALTKEEVIALVLNLYDVKKEAKEYLEFIVNPDHDAKYREYKQIISNEFYPKRGEPKLRFSICRSAISDFRKLKPQPIQLADLMLFYIETGVEFTVEFGDMWEQYYDTLVTNFDKAMKVITEFGLIKEFEPRIKKLLKSSEVCGWGFPDGLYDVYDEYQ